MSGGALPGRRRHESAREHPVSKDEDVYDGAGGTQDGVAVLNDWKSCSLDWHSARKPGSEVAARDRSLRVANVTRVFRAA